MFNKEKIQALEQSVATLTEELNSEKEAIGNLLESLKMTDEKVNKLQSEKDELEKKYNSLANNLSGYAEKVSEEFKRTYEKCENSSITEEIKALREHVGELAVQYSSADEKHNAQIETLTKSTDALVKKCEDIQLSNVQIMNEHRDMIKRYEESIKGYAKQTERMQNNVLKKMNANNIISVVEE